jgi:hypothetical protein
LHDDDDSRSRGYRDHRVHHNAKLAVIGVRLIRVNVGALSKRQQSKQNQAQGRDSDCGVAPDQQAFLELAIDVHPQTFNTSPSRATI